MSSIFHPLVHTALKFIFLFLIVFAAHHFSFYEKPIQFKHLEGTDLIVRVMPEDAVSFIKKNYPPTDKRLIIYSNYMISHPNPPCSKEMILTFNRLKDNPEYQNGYLITPLITTFKSFYWTEGNKEEEKKAMADYDKYVKENLAGNNSFAKLCDLAFCIVDLENHWVFDWDNLSDSATAYRMKEIFDLFKK